MWWNCGMHRLLAAILLAAVVPVSAGLAHAGPREIASALPQARQVGAAEFRWLFWSLFDAALWSSDGRFSWERPFALSLTYRTGFTAAELTDSTMEEMTRLSGWPAADLAGFRAEVAACMADVGDGDRFTAAGPSADSVVLFLNGEQRCRLDRPGLRRAYFSIWLDENSRFPAKTRALISASS
jgi:hypothetical protein